MSSKEIIIFDEEGGKLMSIQEMRKVSISEFVDRLQTQRISTPILPRVIWYEDNGVDKTYVTEVAPRKRLIPFFDKYYECGFPFLIFAIRTSGNFISNVALAIAKSDINDFDDPLFRVPLPNMDDRSLLCLGAKFDTEIAQITNPLKKVKYVLPFFESSRYNDHLLPFVDWIPPELRVERTTTKPNGIETRIEEYHKVLEKWQEMTHEEDWVQVVLGGKKTKLIDWIPLGVTFRKFVKEGP